MFLYLIILRIKSYAAIYNIKNFVGAYDMWECTYNWLRFFFMILHLTFNFLAVVPFWPSGVTIWTYVGIKIPFDLTN